MDDDPWLGTIRQFPTVLHARASVVHDLASETLQKILVHCFMQLQKSTRPIELSLSDRPGYLNGTVAFKVGVGNDDGFDILDAGEKDRVLRRILLRGVFQTLDLSFELHYKVRSTSGHRVARDQYLARLSFQTGRTELLIHHLKGLKRIDPDELVHILLSIINTELTKKGFGELELEESQAD